MRMPRPMLAECLTYGLYTLWMASGALAQPGVVNRGVGAARAATWPGSVSFVDIREFIAGRFALLCSTPNH
jgi:hypothetical protein